MAVTRTAKGAGATSKTSGTTLALASIAMTTGDLLVVSLTYDTGTLNSVTWGSETLTLETPVTSGGQVTRLAWKQIATGGTQTITATWASAIVAKAFVASSYNATGGTGAWRADTEITGSGSGTAASTAAIPPIVGGTNSILVAAVGGEGPSGDAAGTWVTPATNGQRIGTTGNPAGSNITVSEAYALAPANGTTPALSKTGMTSVAWAASMHAFYYGAVLNAPFYLRNTAGPSGLSYTTATDITDTRGSSATSDRTEPLSADAFHKSFGGSTPGTTRAFALRVNAVTIAGPITFNLRGSRSTTTGLPIRWACSVYRHSSDGTYISDVIGTGGVHWGASISTPGTTELVQNWAITPTSTSFNQGDLLVVVPHVDDTNPVTSGFGTLFWDGPTEFASGDSWIRFTETVTEYIPPPAIEGDFTVDAVVRDTEAGSFPVDAEVSAVLYPPITWGAWSPTWQNPISGGGIVVDSFTVDAVQRKPGNAGAFTVNAVIKRAAAGSFPVNAVLEREQTGSTTVNALVKRSQAGSFPVDALLKKTGSSSFTINANLRGTRTGSFTVDAWVPGKGAGGFTLNAVIRKPGNAGSFVLDAVTKRSQASSFTIAAVVRRPGQAGSFTLNAIAKVTDLNTLTLDAVVRRPNNLGAFTLNALLKRSAAGSFPVDAIRRRSQTGAFTVDAFITQKASSSFPVNALVRRTQTGSFTVNAFIPGVGAGAFTVDAVLLKHRTSGVAPFSPTSISGLAIWLDASTLTGTSVSTWPNSAPGGVAPTVIGTPSLTVTPAGLNGLPIVHFSQSVGGALRWSGTGIDLAWTVVFVNRMTGPNYARVITSSYPPSNLLIGQWNGQEDVAYVEGFLTPSAAATVTNAWKLYSAVGSGVPGAANAYLYSNGVYLSGGIGQQNGGGWKGYFNVNGYSPTGNEELSDTDVAEVLFYDHALSDAERAQVEDYLRTKWLTGPTAGGPTIDAWIQKRITASFPVAATIRGTQTGSFTVNAQIRSTGASSFTVQAVIKRAASAATTVDAVIKATKPGSFTASAIVKRTAAGSFLLDAVLKKPQASSFTLNAVLRRGATGSFPVDALLRRQGTGSFPVDAIARRAGAGSTTVNAWIRYLRTGGFTVAAIARKAGGGNFLVEAWVGGTGVGGFVVNAVVKRTATSSFTVNAIRLAHMVPSTAWSPAQISGIVAWLDATQAPFTDGQAIDAYTEHGPNHTVFTSGGPSTGTSPTFRASVGGMPRIHFDGNDWLGIPAWTVPPAGTTFVIVLRSTGFASYDMFITSEGGGAGRGIEIRSEGGAARDQIVVDYTGYGIVFSNSWSYSLATDTVHVLRVNPGVATESWVDGHLTVGGTLGATHGISGNLWFGRRDDGYYLNAHVGEAFVFDRAISDADLALLTQYLDAKWRGIGSPPTAAGGPTVDAWINGRVIGGLTVSAIIRRASTGSFPVDAWLTQRISGSFSLNAVVKRPAASSFTVDAFIKASRTGSFPVDAAVKATKTGSFTVEAILLKHQIGGGGGTITIGQTGNVNGLGLGFTAVAGRIIVVGVACRAGNPVSVTPGSGFVQIAGGTGTNNANLFMFAKLATGGETTLGGTNSGTPVTASFEVIGGVMPSAGSGAIGTASTANPYSCPPQTPTPGSSSVVIGAGMQDAGTQTLSATGASGFTGVGGVAGPADWPHTLAMYRVVPSAAGTYTPAFNNGNGWRLGTSGIIYAAVTAVTIDAVIAAVTAVKTFTVDAVIRKAQASSFTVNASVVRPAAGAFTLDATIRKPGGGAFTVQAVQLKHQLGGAPPPTYGKFTPITYPSGDAGPKVLWRGKVNAQLDVVVTVTQNATATGDNMYLRLNAGTYSGQTGISPKDSGYTATRTFRFFGNPPSGITTGDNSGNLPGPGFPEVTVEVGIPGNPTTWTMLDVSVKQSGVEIGFGVVGPTIDALITASRLGSFTLAAVIRRPQASSFTVGAEIAAGTILKTFTVNAVIRGSRAGSFPVDASVRKPVTGSFTVNAVLLKNRSTLATTPPFSVGFNSNVKAWNVAGGLSITTPAATQDGDVLVAFIVGDSQQNPTGRFINAPAGWVKLGEIQAPIGGDNNQHAMFAKQASGEPATQDFTWSEVGYAGGLTGGVVALRDAAWPVRQVPRAVSARSNNHSTAQITNVLANSLVGAAFAGGGSSTMTWTSTSGLVELWDRWTQYVAGEVGYAIAPTAGTYGTFGASVSGPSFSTIAYIWTVPPRQGFKVDAWIRTAFTVDAWIVRGFRVNAVINRQSTRTFTVSAWIRATFTIDAWISRGNEFWIDAIIKAPTQQGVFTVAAFISRNTFTLDAYIRRGGKFNVSAAIKKTTARTFALDAEVFAGTRLRSFPVRAIIRGKTGGAWYTNAEIRLPHGEVVGEFDVDAALLDHMTGSFELEARIFDGKWTKSFTVDADLKGQNEKRGTFPVRAVINLPAEGVFNVSAEIGGQGYFRLDAYIVPWFTIDAEIAPDLRPTGSFTIDARVTNGREFKVSAILRATGSGSFGIGGEVWRPGLQDGRYFWIDAWIQSRILGSFTLNAKLAGGFTVDAFVQPYFTVDAYIRSNDYIIWPDDGGPATDPDGVPLPDWFKASRKYRVKITIDGVDVTGDVNWAKTTFTQQAKTNPGTFELVLYGPQPYDGGETILVELDDFRTFGGYVLQIERGYVFEADADWPVTVLRGADFNILFDKLITYNRASADDPSGKYTPYKAFAKGSLDTRIIRKVFDSYIDKPKGLEYKMFVETAGVAAPEKPWAMPTSGAPLRQVMQSLSQVTNAVWWIDPYLHLHYGPRTKITAPFPITDGKGGISSANLSMSEDMSNLVTDGFLWGVLAYTVEGEMMVGRKKSALYNSIGPWQYGEFRSDLHHERYIDRRMDSVIERYGKPIKKAKAVIFEPGYQAGQVVDVRLTEHGLTAPLVIQQMALTFAVSKGPRDGYWYCVPRFELSIGLDPEDPWDIYDYLPFKGYPYHDPGGWRRCTDCQDDCVDDVSDPESGGCASMCYTDSFNRVVPPSAGPGGWGNADSGFFWEIDGQAGYAYHPDALASVDGNDGVFTMGVTSPDDFGPSIQAYGAGIGFSPDFDLTFEIEFDIVTSQYVYFDMQNVVASLNWQWARIWLDVGYNDSDEAAPYIEVSSGGTGMGTSRFGPRTPIGFSPNVRYKVRFQRIEGSVVQAKIWPMSQAEPVNWTTSVSIAGMPVWPAAPSQDMEIYLTKVSGMPGAGTVSTSHMKFGNLQIAGVSNCGGVQFDSFDRVSASGLGTATNGVPWVAHGNSATTVSVNGSEAVLSSSSPGAFAEFWWNDGELVDAPWWVASVNAVPATVTLRPATGRTRFRFDFDPPGAGQGFVRLIVNPGDGDDPLINISNASGNYGFSGSTIAKTNWVRNKVYIAEWVFTNPGFQFCVYEEGTAPGAWSIDENAMPGDAMCILRYDNQAAAGAKPIYIDSIDFDYDGKPCSPTGLPGQIDSFERNLPLSPAVGAGQGTLWGPLSSGDGMWVNGGQWNGGAESDVWYGVEAGLGRVRHTNHGQTSSTDTVSVLSLTDTRSGYYPWNVDGAGVPDYLFTQPTLTMSIDFMCDRWELVTGQTYQGTYIEMDLSVNWDGYDGQMIGLDTNYLHIYGQGTSIVVPQTHINGAWYTYKLYMTGTTAYVKVWQRDTPEPDWQGSKPIEPRPWHNDTTSGNPWSGEFAMMLQSIGTPGSFTNFYFDNFTSDSPAVPPYGPGGADPTAPGGPCADEEGEAFGAVTQGWGCETLRVKDEIVELTGQAARSTLTLYDAESGEHIAEGWFEDQAGKTFRVPSGVTRVTACYRNYTPEIGSNPSVPRLTSGSVGRERYAV